MQTGPFHTAGRYGLATAMVLAAWGGGLLLSSVAPAALLLMPAAACVWSAWRGGAWQGYYATILASAVMLIAELTGGADLTATLLESGIFALLVGFMVRLVARARALHRVRRRRRGRKLGEAEVRFRGLIDAAPDAIVAADESRRIVLVNSETEKLFGYRREELLGRTIDLLLPERFTPNVGDMDCWDPLGVGCSGREFAGRRSDGSQLPIEVTISPLDTGSERLAIAVMRNITDRKRTEDQRLTLIREQAARMAAEAAEQRAAFLAEASHVLAGSLDYETTLRSVAGLAVPHMVDWCALDIAHESGAIELLAFAHQDSSVAESARTVLERYPVDPAAPRGVANVIRTGTSEIYERVPGAGPETQDLHALRQLGARSAMIVPMTVRNRTFGALTFGSSEPNRRYGPADLAFAEELARHSALAIENARLYASAQQERSGAEAANRMKDEFLATLSHELRTPVNALIGWTRLLLTGALDPRATEEAHETIARNAQAQAQIINDLLDTSRVITGQLRLHVQSVDLVRVAQEAIDALRMAADAKNLRLQGIFDPGEIAVQGDPDRLRQILWNLISNAVKFTPRGGRIQVRVTRVGADGEVAVSDTGIGIERNFLPFVFDRFRQADGSTTRAHGGLGLGLAVVRHLVELHGGSVRAQSPGIGSGTTFTVSIPLSLARPILARPTLVTAKSGDATRREAVPSGIERSSADSDNDRHAEKPREPRGIEAVNK